ncbi:MAG: hypothetical protein HZB39_03450 [Planctomycetes bacterium]|nr:hypothetical protein [Planctomycetota bacterium]
MPAESGVADWFALLLAEPLLFEVPLLVAIAVVLVVRDRRSVLRARRATGHPALDERLLGVEAWLARDAATAVHRLVRACEGDPHDAIAKRLLAAARERLAVADSPAHAIEDAVAPAFPADRRFLEERAAVAAWIARVPELMRRIDDPRRVLDALELNRAHLARVVAAAIDGDDAARAELIELGGASAGEVLHQVATLGADDDRGVALCAALGADLFAALLAELATMCERRSERSREFAVVRRVAAALGASADPGLDSAARGMHAALRELALDAAIEGGDATGLARRAHAASPGELRRAVARARPEFLARIVAAPDCDSLVLAAILDDPRPTLWRALVDVQAAGSASALLSAALRRDTTLAVLAPQLAAELDAATPSSVLELVAAAGNGAADALALRATDPSLRPADRAPSLDLLAACGAAAVGALGRTVGDAPSPTDRYVVAAWVALGADAVLPLRAFLDGVLRIAESARRDHRGRLAIEALAAIGTSSAKRVLDALRRQAIAPELAAAATDALAAHARSRRTPS